MLHEILDRRAAENPDGPFVATADRRVSNAEAQNAVRSLAGALHDVEVRPGERIAVLGPNSIEYVELIYAASHVGAALVGLNTRLADEEWAFAIDAGCIWAISARSTLTGT